MRNTIAILAALTALTGCKEEVHDSDYYYNHLSEARDVAQKCQNGEISGENCANAKDALFKNNQKNGKVMHN